MARTSEILQAIEEGAGSPLVMLGGGTFGAAAFAPHAHTLANHYRVIRLQTLNVERAEKQEPLPLDYSVNLESAAMANAIDRLEISSPMDVVGWSYGGAVALDYALNHPHMIRKLALFEPPALWVVSPGERASDTMRGIFALGKEFGASMDPTDDQAVRFYQEIGNANVNVPAADQPEWKDWTIRRAALKCLPAVSNQADDPARLKAFRRPVLMMHGAATVPFHRRITEILAATLPMATLVVMPGDHAVPITARDEFLGELKRFFGPRPGPAGLCGDCSHAERVVSARGATFFLCRLSFTDARFRKYPPLPVLECAGYQMDASG